VEVPAVPYKDLMTESTAEPSADIGERVAAARTIQSGNWGGYCVINHILRPNNVIYRTFFIPKS